MRKDSSFCAKSVRYNIFTNGAPYSLAESGCNGVLRGVTINTEGHIISNTSKTGVNKAGTQFVESLIAPDRKKQKTEFQCLMQRSSFGRKVRYPFSVVSKHAYGALQITFGSRNRQIHERFDETFRIGSNKVVGHPVPK